MHPDYVRVLALMALRLDLMPDERQVLRDIITAGGVQPPPSYPGNITLPGGGAYTKMLAVLHEHGIDSEEQLTDRLNGHGQPRGDYLVIWEALKRIYFNQYPTVQDAANAAAVALNAVCPPVGKVLPKRDK